MDFISVTLLPFPDSVLLLWPQRLLPGNAVTGLLPDKLCFLFKVNAHIHTYTHVQIRTRVHAHTLAQANAWTSIHTHNAGSLHLSLFRIRNSASACTHSSFHCGWIERSSSPTGPTLFSRWPSCPLQQPSIPDLSGPHTQGTTSLTLFFTDSAPTPYWRGG